MRYEVLWKRGLCSLFMCCCISQIHEEGEKNKRVRHILAIPAQIDMLLQPNVTYDDLIPVIHLHETDDFILGKSCSHQYLKYCYDACAHHDASAFASVLIQLMLNDFNYVPVEPKPPSPLCVSVSSCSGALQSCMLI